MVLQRGGEIDAEGLLKDRGRGGRHDSQKARYEEGTNSQVRDEGSSIASNCIRICKAAEAEMQRGANSPIKGFIAIYPHDLARYVHVCDKKPFAFK